MIIDFVSYYNRLVSGDQKAAIELMRLKPEIDEIAVDMILRYKDGFAPNLDQLNALMRICNAFYNNTDNLELIEDGIYDMLMNIYKQEMPTTYQVGADVIALDEVNQNLVEIQNKMNNLRYPIKTPDLDKDEVLDNWLFKDQLFVSPQYNPNFYNKPIDRKDYPRNEKSTKIIPHKYPKLVGTLDKCKFTLISECFGNPDLLNDPTIKIFERDFLGAQLQYGLLDPNHITLLAELKMDGMSVEADTTNVIQSARSRGDTGLDLAYDLTPVLKGYRFENCPDLDESIGVKFEAIITKTNLERLTELKGKSYKNSRNGIVGLLKSIDAYAYRDLITLVPLETSLDIDPVDEVKFLNRYFTKDVALPWALIEGDYNSVLYQVYRFVKEAEKMRPAANFLYDGVVIHHVDKNIRQHLGRINSVNKYSIAIKFNPMAKKTVFREYSYTVGQNGIVIPMAHYDPVEFLGTIHTKSSCHSFGRFKELHLSKGEIITVSYVNDVMPYVTRAFEEYSENPPEQFPTICPFCGTPLAFPDGYAGDSAFCPNLSCPEREVSRITNMLEKLNIKGFSEMTVRKMKIHSLTNYLQIDLNTAIEAIGNANGTKFIKEREKFLNTKTPDYRIVGALGFTNIASGTWKKILENISLQDIMVFGTNELYNRLLSIKSIGEAIASVVCNERCIFEQDLRTILGMPNCVFSYGVKKITVRWTGCRDAELESQLEQIGIDADSKQGVTKTTSLLVVPYTGYTSTKMNKIGPRTLIVDLEEFKKNTQYYINMAYNNQ